VNLMSDLLVGVIGTGGRGNLARHAHKPGKGSRVVACCDIVPDLREQAREWYGNNVRFTVDYHELLADDIDAVFITTPDYLHEEQAVAALESGKAVYLEKPMAITIQGCDRILRAACSSNAKLYVGHNMRHMVFVLKMKEIIDSGAIGDVKAAWCRHFVAHGGDWYFKDWHAERRFSTGLLLQKATHDLDVLHWLCGSYPRLVHALGGLTLYDQVADRRPTHEPPAASADLDIWPALTQSGLNPIIDVEDLSMMQMQLENGVLVSYQQCHYTPDYWRNYTFIGTEGRIENQGDLSDDAVVRLWNRRTNYSAAGDQAFSVGGQVGGHGGADKKAVAEFVRYARDGGQTSTSPLAARYSVAAGCAATESLRSGGDPVEIPAVEPHLRAFFE
jgi:predicted dehydrogenase